MYLHGPSEGFLQMPFQHGLGGLKQITLAFKVVGQIAWADAEIPCDPLDRDVLYTVAIEELDTTLDDARRGIGLVAGATQVPRPR